MKVRLEMPALMSRIFPLPLSMAALLLAGGSSAAQPRQHAEQLAGYWTTDAQWSSQINSASRPAYFWVGRTWGRVDATGRVQFQADNGCVSTGLLSPIFPEVSWSGTLNIEGCKQSDMNGRYSATVQGGKASQPMSLQLRSTRFHQGGKTDTYEVKGTFTRYRP